MADTRYPGSTGRRRPADARPNRPVPRRITRRLALAPLAAVALLTGLAPATLASHGLQLTTQFPDVAVAPGDDVTFDLQVSTNRSSRIALAVQGVPSGWTAKLQGGGFVVDGVATRGSTPVEIQLNVTVPAEATGVHGLTVRATSEGETVNLPLNVRVAEGAAGDITMDTEIPVQEGPSSQTFRFPLTLHNDTAEEVTASVTATGPTGWQVESQIAGQAQAASAIVAASDTLSVEISVTPAEDAEAGDYPIDVVATAGGKTINNQVGVRITGSYSIVVGTPDDRLSTRGEAGSTIVLPMTISNSGTAPITNLQMEGTGPTDWTVDFDQDGLIASIAPGADAQINARIHPSDKAIAGDYQVTVTANAADQANESQTIRVTVETSPVWGIVGIGLIVVVLGGLLWVFRTYGRR
ncbi:MAG TPA: NEW3 domain-containing protein [Candidatus Limnocylindrales bacterium]